VLIDWLTDWLICWLIDWLIFLLVDLCIYYIYLFIDVLVLTDWCGCYWRIYLIDHAWTYRPDQARPHLESMPSLLSRMALLMDIGEHNRQREDVVEDVLTLMWRCVNYYFAARMSAFMIILLTLLSALFNLLSHNLQTRLAIAVKHDDCCYTCCDWMTAGCSPVLRRIRSTVFHGPSLSQCYSHSWQL